MAETVTVQGPIHVQSDSPHRVAYDLMLQINYYDKTAKEKRDEDYFLMRYARCLRVVRGNLASTPVPGGRPDTLT